MEFNNSPLDDWEKIALIQASLDWCNERRVEMGKEPLEILPQGRTMDPASCPCGAATGLRVEAEYYEPPGLIRGERQHWYKPLPELVQQFIEHFDAELIPELDVEKAGWFK